jgi:hypothetical protein
MHSVLFNTKDFVKMLVFIADKVVVNLFNLDVNFASFVKHI